MATLSQLSAFQNKVFTRLYLANWRNQHTLIKNSDQNLLWQLIWGVQGRHEQGESTTSLFAQRRTMVASLFDVSTYFRTPG